MKPISSKRFIFRTKEIGASSRPMRRTFPQKMSKIATGRVPRSNFFKKKPLSYVLSQSGILYGKPVYRNQTFFSVDTSGRRSVLVNALKNRVGNSRNVAPQTSGRGEGALAGVHRGQPAPWGIRRWRRRWPCRYGRRPVSIWGRLGSCRPPEKRQLSSMISPRGVCLSGWLPVNVPR